MTLKEKLQELIEKYEASHRLVLLETSDGNFYSLRIDEDGVPFSFGNADDVYSDGFDSGTYQGEADVIFKLKELLEYDGL